MRFWPALPALLLTFSAMGAETIPFNHWTVMSHADPDSDKVFIAAWTRNRDGHMLAFGQQDNGPIEGALILNENSGSEAHAGHALRVSIARKGEHRVADLRIPDSARNGDRSEVASRVEWPVWEKRQGGKPPSLLSEMREGEQLELEFRDAQGQAQQTHFSLKGADRALAWILQEGPMTASYHTVDTLSEDAALQCRRQADGDPRRRDTCFDRIVSCWDKQGNGSVAAFRGCLSNEGVM
ncbi:hypothetical protein [Thioalkalivibrio thiocyanodenitrificans]|uniref:hypothetical protein n=1 Tax=Thioalkalivibrio thiocyanodenitrificans TaxID=243063 RepID=UPI00036B8AB2|nr:hypothetical protein [Thioalkalivibrio thiocyanodenitrificans]